MRYVILLHKWNRVYNLTAVRDIPRMVSHHVLDSLAILPHFKGSQVLDVGTGPGLPGIPLAIAQPQMSVTLLDSIQKKTAFLQQAVSELDLKNAKVVCERVEAGNQPTCLMLSYRVRLPSWRILCGKRCIFWRLAEYSLP